MQSELPSKVLVVDDDQSVIDSIEKFLSPHGIQVHRAMDVESAMYQFTRQIFEVVLVELEFAPLPGLALVQKFRLDQNPDRRKAGIILSSGLGRKVTDENLFAELGDLEMIEKPLTALKLLPALNRALGRRRSIIQYDMVKSLAYDLVEKEGDVEKAIGYVKNNINNVGEKGTSLMIDIYEKGGRNDLALKLSEMMLEKNAGDIAMLNTKSRLLLKMGKVELASEFMEQAEKSAPGNIARLQTMASTYLDMEDPDKAVVVMKDLIELSPEEKALRFNFFQDLEDQGYLRHAIGLCKETTPPIEVIRHFNNKGVAFARKQRFEDALIEYNAALKFYPDYKDNYRLIFNIGIAELSKKSLEGVQAAEIAFQRCLDIRPNYEKAKLKLDNVQQVLARHAMKSKTMAI